MSILRGFVFYVLKLGINRSICRAALSAKDADCTLLPHIPFPDVQKEGIQKFSGDTPAFVLSIKSV